MEEPIIKVEHLSHRYSIQWAVRDVSLEIPRHGIYGLLGSNGAGKSTIMNIICGVIKQTEGDVFISGVDARTNPVEAKFHIGFLPQKPPLYGNFTVKEYLLYTASLRWMDDKEAKEAVDQVMEKCRIKHFSNRLIKNLSGGYQQRVGIAQAIVHRPDLVVFDEPTNGLDPNQIIEIRSLIKEIAEECTVILSTHMLSEVHAICDSILMIEDGKVVFSGTIDEFDNCIVPDSIYVEMNNAPSVEVLAATEGVTKVVELSDSKYRLHFSDINEVMDSVVKKSANNDWKLTEMRLEKSSLDSIFAKLSNEYKN